MEIKKKMSNYQLKIFIGIIKKKKIPIGHIKKLVPNFFEKEKCVLHYEHLHLYLDESLNKRCTVY